MIDWETLVRKYLPEVEPAALETVIGYLEKNFAPAAADQIAPAYARLLAKGIDGVATITAAMVQRGDLQPDQAQGLMIAWVRAARDAASEIGNACEAYAPLALAVNLAEHPPKDMPKDQAAAALAAAKKARKEQLATLRADARQYLEAIAGGSR